MTTDTDALTERIARALATEADEQEDGAVVWGDPGDLAAAFEEEVEGWERFAAALLPILHNAMADAWDEGCTAGDVSAYHGNPTPPNPYRDQESTHG